MAQARGFAGSTGATGTLIPAGYPGEARLHVLWAIVSVHSGDYRAVERESVLIIGNA